VPLDRLGRNPHRYPGKTSRTKAFYQWLGSLNFERQASQTAFTEYWPTVQAGEEHVKRLDKALQGSVQGWRFEPVVDALQALRGIDVTSAIGLVVEIGGLSRFDHPHKLMGYLGPVPSQHSSGDKVSRGSITKTGNSRALGDCSKRLWPGEPEGDTGDPLDGNRNYAKQPHLSAATRDTRPRQKDQIKC